MAWKIIPEDTALSTADLLVNVLTKFGVLVVAMWRDNGGEFRAQFDDVLQRFGIHHITTDPYTRQQNGTIERFWSTADKASSVKELPGVFESDN
jgi:transposase InsO family protein